jgi:hypothetical protein
MRKSLLKQLLYTLIFAICITPSANAMNYSDVPQGFWAYRQIDELTNDNIIYGYEDNTYRPKRYVTRAEYSSMVIKALNQEDTPFETMYSFEDVNTNHWAWRDIIRAVNLDILHPVGAYFYPNDYITRSDVIIFLVNILKSEGITKKEAINALQNNYLDFDDVPDWFKVTAGKAEVLNVIAKEPPRQNYLDYDKYVTRAQLAVFLYNLKSLTDSYVQQKLDEEKSPKIGEGIVIENVLLNDDVATIPARTILPIMISGQLDTKNTSAGEMFKAKFANNIVDDEHHILLSKDIVLVGKVLDSTKALSFVRNGELIFEITATNKDNNYTRILGFAECEVPNVEDNVILKATKNVVKGRNYVAKDGQILYIKLFKPIRANIVTGEVLD